MKMSKLMKAATERNLARFRPFVAKASVKRLNRLEVVPGFPCQLDSALSHSCQWIPRSCEIAVREWHGRIAWEMKQGLRLSM